MRLTPFLFAAGAFADLATITSVLTTVTDQVGQLDTAVKGFSGDISGVQTAAGNLLTTVKSGTDTVKGSGPLTLIEASQVAQSVTGLNTTIASVVDGLISKKAAFVSAGAGATVLATLQDQKTASQGLAEAITSKVPEALQNVASELSSGVSASLQRGIDAFTGTGGGSSSPSAGPTSGGSSAPSATATGSATGTGAHTGHGSKTSAAPTAPAPTGSTPATPSKPVGTAPGASSSKPPLATFTGAAVANRVGGVMGAVAAVVVLAL